MRKYVCDQIHIVEFDNHISRDIFCKQCNKWIWKGHLYIFQFNKTMQRYYLAPSLVSDIERKQISIQKAVERTRRYRLKKKQLLEVAA